MKDRLDFGVGSERCCHCGRLTILSRGCPKCDGRYCKTCSRQHPCPRLVALTSNDGWQGKTVQTWVHGNQQEHVSEKEEHCTDCQMRFITVAPASIATGEGVACTNVAGEQVAFVNTPFHQTAMWRVKCAVAAACGCNAGAVQLLTVDGRRLQSHPSAIICGRDRWTLGEASSRLHA
eukprot:gnl/MRDRNA2_/MRDRNA2_98252_c0_seq1.p1 gnl/MRDRNA2_/MRDRNA2_98252_c0~~gnl/MRDRNA2_/MRDRNA2_98252_c0_seq1.p1  ORF type:complete len:177 (-),score=21.57 gnl/MRDRNA2_/MRDRNA2_98252_c0_seq1:242-772(-)